MNLIKILSIIVVIFFNIYYIKNIKLYKKYQEELNQNTSKMIIQLVLFDLTAPLIFIFIDPIFYLFYLFVYALFELTNLLIISYNISKNEEIYLNNTERLNNLRKKINITRNITMSLILIILIIY